MDKQRDKSNSDWFSRASSYYEHTYGSLSATGRFLNERVAKVEQLLEGSSGNLLDGGCGIGMLFRRLAPERFHCFGVDISPGMLAHCKSGVGDARHVDLAQARLEHLPFSDESFDVALALGVLEYLPRTASGVEELARVTRRDGIVIVSMHNKMSLYRIWERVIYKNALAVRARLTDSSRSPRLQLHTQRSLVRMLQKNQLKPVEVIYYDFNVIAPPLDRLYPRHALLVNTKLEKLFHRNLMKIFATGFLVKARKCPREL